MTPAASASDPLWTMEARENPQAWMNWTDLKQRNCSWLAP